MLPATGHYWSGRLRKSVLACQLPSPSCRELRRAAPLPPPPFPQQACCFFAFRHRHTDSTFTHSLTPRAVEHVGYCRRTREGLVEKLERESDCSAAVSPSSLHLLLFAASRLGFLSLCPRVRSCRRPIPLPSLPPPLPHPIAIRPRVTPHHRRRFTSSQCCTMTVVTIAIIIIIVVDGFRESKGRGGFYPFLRDVRRSTTASDCRGLRERENLSPFIVLLPFVLFYTSPLPVSCFTSAVCPPLL